MNDSDSSIEDVSGNPLISTTASGEDFEITDRFGLGGSSQDVKIVGDYGYVAQTQGLYIYNISNLVTPTLVGRYKTVGNATSVAVAVYYAYVADSSYGLVVVDISNPASPSLVVSYDTIGTAYGVALSGGYVLLADDDNGLEIINLNQ